MKKRLAEKAFSGRYFNVWVNPKTRKVIYIPRNGRCWCIIQRACYYFGHPEWIEEITNKIITTVKNESGDRSVGPLA